MMSSGDAALASELRALLSQGRYQEILDRYPALEPVGDPVVTLAIATAATRLGRLDRAEALAGDAHAAFRSRADDDGRLRALNLLGAIAFEQGRLEIAIEHWVSGLELARALGDNLLVARTANNLAITHHLEGRTEEARSLYRETMLAYQRLGDRRGLAEAHHNLAITYRLEGTPHLAASLNLEAIRHAERVADPVLLALTLVGRAETLVATDDLVLAEEELGRAEQLCREARDDLELAECSRVRAGLELKRGRPQTSFELAEQGRSAAEKHGSQLLQGECAAAATLALARLGRADEARRYWHEAERVFKSLGAKLYLERLPVL